MHKYACLNQEITDASKIDLPAVSAAAFYGRAVFTTVAVYNSQPFQWSRHWERLTENARRLGIDLSEITEKTVVEALARVIARNLVKTGRARITLFDLSAGGTWQSENQNRSACLIATADLRPVPADLQLTISPYPVNSRSPLAGVKSANYLENLLALEEAKKRGFNEALRFNEKGAAVSAIMANVFWTRAEEIFTPPLSAGPLAGTTRAFVLENFRIREKTVLPDELRNADEIFLTSAGLGIARAGSFENRKFAASNVFSRVSDSFHEFIYKIP